jgi:Fic family protein
MLRRCVRQAERGADTREGSATSEREALKRLQRENRERKKATEILRVASAFLAKAELDGQQKWPPRQERDDKLRPAMQRVRDDSFKLKLEGPKMYSHELLSTLFRHPDTKIDYLVRDLSVTRRTASKYLADLVGIGLLSKHKIGKESFYLKESLFMLLHGES